MFIFCTKVANCAMTVAKKVAVSLRLLIFIILL